jgi:hypothetical protein
LILVFKNSCCQSGKQRLIKANFMHLLVTDLFDLGNWLAAHSTHRF